MGNVQGTYTTAVSDNARFMTQFQLGPDPSYDSFVLELSNKDGEGTQLLSLKHMQSTYVLNGSYTHPITNSVGAGNATLLRAGACPRCAWSLRVAALKWRLMFFLRRWIHAPASSLFVLSVLRLVPGARRAGVEVQHHLGGKTILSGKLAHKSIDKPLTAIVGTPMKVSGEPNCVCVCVCVLSLHFRRRLFIFDTTVPVASRSGRFLLHAHATLLLPCLRAGGVGGERQLYGHGLAELLQAGRQGRPARRRTRTRPRKWPTHRMRRRR
jgi:hypothetical protein